MRRKNDEYEGPEHPGVSRASNELWNADGDTAADWPSISFRCGGCGKPHTTVVPPTAPVFAKFLCRYCDYTSTVKTREEIMDQIEGHIEEGENDEKMRKRHSVDLGDSKPSPSVIDTPLGKATLIN